MPRKQRTLSKEIELTWNAFSKLIRLRDAIRTTGDIYYLVCITCSQKKEVKASDAGHWQSRRYKSTLFDPFNVHGQCKQCNGPFNGRAEDHRRKIISMYSEEVLEDIYQRRNDTTRFTAEELQTARKLYNVLFQKLYVNPNLTTIAEVNMKMLQINKELCKQI